jgi:hypothetical protein
MVLEIFQIRVVRVFNHVRFRVRRVRIRTIDLRTKRDRWARAWEEVVHRRRGEYGDLLGFVVSVLSHVLVVFNAASRS